MLSDLRVTFLLFLCVTIGEGGCMTYVAQGLDKPDITKVSKDLEPALNNKTDVGKLPIFLTTFSTRQNIF